MPYLDHLLRNVDETRIAHVLRQLVTDSDLLGEHFRCVIA